MIFKLSLFTDGLDPDITEFANGREARPKDAVEGVFGPCRLHGADHTKNVTWWRTEVGLVRCEPAVPAGVG